MSESPSSENTQAPGSQPSPPVGAASVSADVGALPAAPRPNPSVPAPPRPSRNPPGSLPPRSSSAPPPRVSAPRNAAPLSQSSFDMPPSTIDGMPPATEDRPSTGPLRRRSRRVVKTEDDVTTDQQQLSETPPPVAQAVPVVPSLPVQTPPFAPVTKSPPPPPLEALPTVVVQEVAPEPPPLSAPADPSEMEPIRPMRILAIGDDLPPVSVPRPDEPVAAANVATTETPSAPPPRPQPRAAVEIPEDGWTPAPPKVAEIATALASGTAQAAKDAALPPPLPAKGATPPPLPAREATPPPLPAKEAAATPLPLPTRETAPPTLKEAPSASAGPTPTEVILPPIEPVDDGADVELDVPISKEGAELAAHDIEAEEEIEVEAQPAPAQPTAAAPKKPAPPPLPPKAPPPVKTAPPPPPVAAPAQAPQKPPTLPEPSRRRQRPWWEDLFDDDFIRTMDRTDTKVIHREVDFIEQCLGLEKGATILDLACGTGRHAVELSSRGYAVVGYDLSLNMLALAAEEAQDRGQKLNFLQGDMREMTFDQVFDGVYSWSTSFGYFDDEKNFDVLQRMHRALRTGGILVLDIINRDYVAPRQPSMVWFEGDGCVCMDEMQVDFFSSRLKVKRTAMFDDGRSREIDYSMRLYNLHEIGKMMHDADFKVLEVTGHPAHPGVFFGSESPRLIIVAERK